MIQKKQSLSALAVLAQAGDAQACNALLRGLSAWVPATLFKEVNARGLSLCDADVHDLAQDILLDAWRLDLARYRAEKGDFLGFVMARVRWRLADEVRRLTRRSFVSLDGESEECEEIEARGARPDEKSDEAARELTLLVLPAVVEHALHDEPAVQHAVRAYDIERKPLKEVAFELGVHVSNACRSRQRGLGLLRERLPAEVRAAA